jgi:hypothetical protein
MSQGVSGQPSLHVLWDETDRTLGVHASGAPLKMVDELYAECARLIERATPTEPLRMYFDPRGILQHCGFLNGLPSSPSVSIQSIGMMAIGDYLPSSVLCARPEGLYLAGTEHSDGAGCARGYRKKAGAKGPDYSQCPAEYGKCFIEGTHCGLPAERFAKCNSDTFNLCERFPESCGIPSDAMWLCRFPDRCRRSGAPSLPRQLGPLQVGKASPFQTWEPPKLLHCGGICTDGYSLL